ncbi:MAG: nucleotidyltransferase family protein [Alphaproteobacteria bacterium]|nr:nucleotidyltransferase family protein [Alphaproteobacteria bacterium]
MAPEYSTPPNIAIVLLAAGASSRMRGQDKLLRQINDQALILRATSAALASHAAQVVVVLGKNAHLRRAEIAPLGVKIVENKAWSDGMGRSIAHGVRALDSLALGVVIALADMPDIRAQDYDRLIAAFKNHGPEKIIRAMTQDSQPGHPVLFGRRYFGSLAQLSTDTGAREVLRQNAGKVINVALDGGRARTDLDTPDDWDKYQAPA